jgi:hypothetical protein
VVTNNKRDDGNDVLGIVLNLQNTLLTDHREILKELAAIRKDTTGKLDSLEDKIDVRLRDVEKKADHTAHEWSIAKAVFFGSGGLSIMVFGAKYLYDVFPK